MKFILETETRGGIKVFAFACLLLTFGTDVLAGRVCVDRRGRWYYEQDTAAECTAAPVQDTVRCDMVMNLPHCDPPETMSYAASRFPFTEPVRFAGETVRSGERLWQWTKAGPLSRPCAEELATPVYERACTIAPGDIMYLTPPLFIVAGPRMMLRKE